MCHSTKDFVLWCIENKHCKTYTCNMNKNKNKEHGKGARQ